MGHGSQPLPGPSTHPVALRALPNTRRAPRAPGRCSSSGRSRCLAPACAPRRRLCTETESSGPFRCICSQVRVCVIDTGARPTHEDLRDNIVGGWNRCGPLRRRRPHSRALREPAHCLPAWAPSYSPPPPRMASPDLSQAASCGTGFAQPASLAKPCPPARAPRTQADRLSFFVNENMKNL